MEALVPDGETLSNPRYVDVEGSFNIPRRSIKVHDCRIVIGANMYLVTGYWYRYSDVNRSVRTATGLTWRGEIVVINAGRSIPYLKRVKHTRQADIAMSKYVMLRPLAHPIGCSLESPPDSFSSLNSARASRNVFRPRSLLRHPNCNAGISAPAETTPG